MAPATAVVAPPTRRQAGDRQLRGGGEGPEQERDGEDDNPGGKRRAAHHGILPGAPEPLGRLGWDHRVRWARGPLARTFGRSDGAQKDCRRPRRIPYSLLGWRSPAASRRGHGSVSGTERLTGLGSVQSPWRVGMKMTIVRLAPMPVLLILLSCLAQVGASERALAAEEYRSPGLRFIDGLRGEYGMVSPDKADEACRLRREPQLRHPDLCPASTGRTASAGGPHRSSRRSSTGLWATSTSCPFTPT